MYPAEIGSTDSQAEASLGEKRSLRIKRQQQKQVGEANPDAVHRTHSQDTATAAASSPVPNLNRKPQAHPRGRRSSKALGSRSRLAEQSGPISDDSDSAGLAAAIEAAVDHFEGEDGPSTAPTKKPVAARTAQKRKRQQQQQQSVAAAAIATSVQVTRSTEASDRLDADATTEHSRSSEAATPVGTHLRRGQARKQETAFKQQQQQWSEQELDSEQTGSLRRTHRQRKLTPAAAAAVEEFPSLYRNPSKLLPTAHRAKTVRNSISQPESDQDWHQDLEAAAATTTPRRGQSKQTHATSGADVSHMQMSQLVRCGVLPAGTHELLFRDQPCEVEVLSDGMQ